MAVFLTVSLALLLNAASVFSLAQVPQAANSQNPSSPSAEIQKIERSLKENRPQDAQADAQGWVAMQPNDPLAWTYLGMANARLQAIPQAIDAFERAISLAPADARPYLNLALLYAETNQLDKSIALYQTGLALDNRNSMAYYNYGKLLMLRNRAAEASEALKRSVAINPQNMAARSALVEALLRANQRDEARSQVRSLLESDTTPIPAMVSLGSIFIRAGELGEAQTVLNRALSRNPNLAPAYVALSKLYIALRDYTKAIDSARQAVTLAPTSLEAHLALAEAWISAKDHPQALDYLLKVQSQFQDSAAFQYTLGIAQFGAHRPQQAIACFKKAIRRDPRLDVAHFLLGNAFLYTGDLDEAEKSLRTAIALNPNPVLYYNCLARVYEQKGEAFKDAALETTKEVLALDPKDVEARERLDRWSKAESDLPRARALLEQLVHDSPSDISAHQLLADVYYRLNLRQEGDREQQAIRKLEGEAQPPRRSAHEPGSP